MGDHDILTFRGQEMAEIMGDYRVRRRDQYKWGNNLQMPIVYICIIRYDIYKIESIAYDTKYIIYNI